MRPPSDDDFECGRCGCALIILVTILIVALIIIRPSPPPRMKKKTAELVPITASNKELVSAPTKKPLQTLNGKTVLNLNPPAERVINKRLFAGCEVLDTSEPRQVRVVQL